MADADKLYYISDFKCTIAGINYAVMTVTMNLQEAGIPTVVLVINPKPNPAAEDVTAGTVEEFAAWLDILQAQAGTPKGVVSLSFNIKGSSDITDVQKVSLASWPMTQVGFGNIAATGGFNTYVVMQHPIFKAKNAILAMMNTYNDAAEGDNIPIDTDTVKIVLASMDKYLKQKDPNNAVASDEATGLGAEVLNTIIKLDKKLFAKAVAAVKVLNETLVWDPNYAGSKYPFSADVNDFNDHITKGGMGLDTYLLDRASPYDTMMAMTSQMMLMGYGTFTDTKILMRPPEPWAASTLKIAVSELSQIDLPVYSINPVSAVAVMGTGDMVDISCQADGYIDRQGSQGLTRSNATIIGGYFDMSDKIEGYVQVINMPDWLTMYAKGDPSGDVYTDRDTWNSTTAMNTGAANPDASDSALELTTDLFAILRSYCHDEFWRSFRADASTSMGLRLMITKDNVPVCPGVVMDLVSADGKTILTCYIISVQHTIDVQGSQAYTSITGSYVRGANGVQGVYNPKSPVTSMVYRTGSPAAKGKKGGGSSEGAVPKTAPGITAQEASIMFTDQLAGR